MVELLIEKHSKQFFKYLKAMSGRILPVEVDALYNVLILNQASEYEYTQRWEHAVKRILQIKA